MCADISQFIDDFLIYIKEDIKIINDNNVKSENRDKIRLVMNKFAKFSSILIINIIYASVLKMNLLSSNVLDVDHDCNSALDSPLPLRHKKARAIICSQIIRFQRPI